MDQTIRAQMISCQLIENPISSNEKTFKSWNRYLLNKNFNEISVINGDLKGGFIGISEKGLTESTKPMVYDD